jgi:GNAT superfamily N-acetyltransferase
MATLIITYLEMISPDQLKPKKIEDSRFRILEAIEKQWQYNSFLYDFVGSMWIWHDKLIWTDTQWKEYAESDNLRTFIAYYEGSPAGYYELEWKNNEVEITYFGLSPRFIGKGYGGPLLTSALENAWLMKPSRVWVHTCTLDHPAALKNYQARGMQIYKVETIDT